MEKSADMQLPLWNELPNFDLHLDQLLELANGYLKPITGDQVTRTMMHNYFKAEVLVAPDKKSYHRIHLAGAIVVGLLKEIFSLDELKTALSYILDAGSPQLGYDRFAEMFNQEAAGEAFKRSKLSHAELAEMPMAAVIQYDALEALLFWLSARQLLHSATNEDK